VLTEFRILLELQKIPRIYTVFCVKDRVSTEGTFWNSAEDIILCGSDFHSAEFRGIIVGSSAEFRGIKVTST
jgi:hypothetical protein